MKKSAVNRHMFIRDLKRSWPIWVGMCYVYIATYLPQLLSERYADMSRFSLDFTGLAIPVADFLLVLIVFGFMNNSRSANFFLSLPITRGSLFLTKTLACVTVAFVPALITGVIPVLANPGDPVPLYLLAHILLAHVTFLGTALFCMVIIGQSLAFAAISALLQVAAAGVHEIARAAIRASIYGFNGSTAMSGIVEYLTPVLHFISAGFYNSTSPHVGGSLTDAINHNNIELRMSVFMALGGLALGIIAYFAFKKRKAESAGDIIVFKFLQPIFKYCVAFCSALLFTILILQSFDLAGGMITLGNLTVICALLAFNTALGYFITEMLMQKKFNVFKKTWKGCAVIAAVIIAAMCFIEFDFLGVETRVPNAEDVEHVFVWGGMSANFEEQENIENVIALHEYLIAHKEDIETSKIDYYSFGTVQVPTGLGTTVPVGDERYRTVEKGASEPFSEYYYNFFYARYQHSIQIQYTLKDGSMIFRDYKSSRLYGDEKKTLELGELCYKLTHTYEYAEGQVFWRGTGEMEDGADISVAVVSEDGKVTTKLDKSLVRELYDAIIADMRDENIAVDDYAPATVERPATLMEDIIQFTIKLESKNQVYNPTYGKPSSMAEEKQQWGAVTLDTRAKNTLAVLEKAGITVK